MNFRKTKNVKGAIFSANFLSNVNFLVHPITVIHHCHVTGNIIGYAHNFYNSKVKENKNQMSVIAQNFFGFDFFFFLKGLTLGLWRTKNISMGGINLVNINFANIANQVKFIDTFKYYQQSLSVLASTMTNEERSNIKKEYKKIIKNDPKLNFKFQKSSDVNQEWILNYLSSGKGVIPYEMIRRYYSLDIAPENGVFFFASSFLI